MGRNGGTIVDVLVVIDKMILGRGVIGVFSTHEKARDYMEEPGTWSAA